MESEENEEEEQRETEKPEDGEESHGSSESNKEGQMSSLYVEESEDEVSTVDEELKRRRTIERHAAGEREAPKPSTGGREKIAEEGEVSVEQELPDSTAAAGTPKADYDHDEEYKKFVDATRQEDGSESDDDYLSSSDSNPGSSSESSYSVDGLNTAGRQRESRSKDMLREESKQEQEDPMGGSADMDDDDLADFQVPTPEDRTDIIENLETDMKKGEEGPEEAERKSVSDSLAEETIAEGDKKKEPPDVRSAADVSTAAAETPKADSEEALITKGKEDDKEEKEDVDATGQEDGSGSEIYEITSSKSVCSLGSAVGNEILDEESDQELDDVTSRFYWPSMPPEELEVIRKLAEHGGDEENEERKEKEKEAETAAVMHNEAIAQFRGGIRENFKDIIAKLELEIKNEVEDPDESECTSISDSPVEESIAEAECDGEWLVTIDRGYEPIQTKPPAPPKTVATAKPVEKESCVCLGKLFPKPEVIESRTMPAHVERRLPVPEPSEHVRKTALEKIVLRKDYNTVTVKFFIRKGEIYTRAYERFAKLLDIRKNLARIFKIPIEMIILQKDGITLSDEVVLETLGIVPCGSIGISLISMDPVGYPLLYENVLNEVPVTVEVPDVINVTMHLPNGLYKELVVEIFNEAIEKPWLGGYRDVKTLVDYHHAFSQTPPLPKKPKFHRDTQTPKPPVTQFQNTPYDKGTQMSRDDYFVPRNEDRILTAHPYIPFEDNMSFLLKQVITIQRYVRAWLIRKLLKNIKNKNKERQSKMEELKKKKEIELDQLITGNAISNIYPRTRQDFSILYNMVERWRNAEIKRICSLKTMAPRKADLAFVLEKEILLLNGIEKHRIAAKKEKLEKKEIDFMEKSAQPITWVGAKGKVISMATINTQRAAELRDLYHELTNYEVSTEQRLNVLVSVKHAIKAFSCQNAKAFDIVELIDRECNVLAHGLKGSQIDYLRKRLAKAFREFMKVPEFNPEGAKHFTEEAAYQRAEGNMDRCKRCHKYVPHDKFVLTNRMTYFQYCVSCSWLETIAGNRIDLSQVRSVMKALRRDERKRCSSTSLAFIMQEEDFYFLIFNIWHGKSSLGESDYMPTLRLCRWNIENEWSPWNCILLSDIEMTAHMKLDDLSLVYSPTFMTAVDKKHKIAFQHFKKMTAFENL